jgi:hypothetical protein
MSYGYCERGYVSLSSGLKVKPAGEMHFDRVKAKYESVKPIVSVRSTLADDVRPIGERRYKQERIIKVDENTYVLSDGILSAVGSYSQMPLDMEVQFAPIMVQRREDGDYIRIRSGSVQSSWMSRHAFLRAYTPMGMSFSSEGGTRANAIHTHKDAKLHVLPRMNYEVDWSAGSVLRDGGEMLWFKQTSPDTYERVSELYTLKTNKIDRDAKSQYRKHLRDYFNWMCVISPMLVSGMESKWRARDAAVAEFMEVGGQDIFANQYTPMRLPTPELSALIKDILKDDDHVLRTALATMVLTECNASIKTFSDVDSMKRFKSQYNRLMNKALDLFATEQV